MDTDTDVATNAPVLPFDLVQKAGITYYEFAEILDVTPPTVYGWLKGRKPSKHVSGRVQRMLDRFTRWIEAGKLPRKEGLSREERRAVVERIKAIAAKS